MYDLISRQALMKEFSDFVRESNNSDFAQTPTWNDAVSLVGSMPSAERRGKKKVFYHGENRFSYVCDQCAMPIDGKDAFCKWCGARMEV